MVLPFYMAAFESSTHKEKHAVGSVVYIFHSINA